MNWRLIGPYKGMDELIKNGTIYPNANKVLSKFVGSGRLKYISGQVNEKDKEDGICRVEWSAGDVYEG